MHKEIREFFRLGKETLYIIIWTAAIGSAGTFAVSAAAYLKGSRRPWTYAGLGATCGMLLVLMAAAAITLLQKARLRSLALKTAPAAGRKGWLDFQVEWLLADKQGKLDMERVAAETTSIGNIFTDGTAKLNELLKLPAGPDLAFRIKKVSSRIATQMDKGSARLALASHSFRDTNARWNENRAGLLKHYISSSSDMTLQRQQTVDFRKTVAETLSKQRLFLSVLQRAEPPTKELDAAYGRLIAVVAEIGDTMEGGLKATDDTIAMIDDARKPNIT